MSTLKTNNLQLLDQSRNIAVSKIAEMNGGFSFRNKIVDGKFDFWYEGTSQTSNGYGSDTMVLNQSVGSTKVHSQQPLVAGVDLPAIDCPSAKYFSRTVVTSVAGAENNVLKGFKIEGVSTLAGKVATLSFYAKADSTKNIGLGATQYFGTGGSAVVRFGQQLVALSTSWKRYSVQITFPSVSGMTIGTGDYIQIGIAFDMGPTYSSRFGGLGQQSGTFDIACVQLEEGSVMTPFEELPIEISKQRVNRYYEQVFLSETSFMVYTYNGDTRYSHRYAVEKRAQPTITYNTTTFNAIGFGRVAECNTTFDIAGTTSDTRYFRISNVAFTGIGGYSAAVTALGYDCVLGMTSSITAKIDARL